MKLSIVFIYLYLHMDKQLTDNMRKYFVYLLICLDLTFFVLNKNYKPS